jgi:hypothetical protein
MVDSPLLFLGFPATQEWEQSIKTINPHLVAYFINGREYLHEVMLSHEKFLGKSVEGVCSLKTLEELQIHILSLLKRINPDFVFPREPLVLISINQALYCGRDNR